MPDSTNARWDADRQSWVGGTHPESAEGETPRPLNIPTLMLVPLVVLLIVVAVVAAVRIGATSPQDQPTPSGAGESQSAGVTASSVPEDAEKETSAGDGGGGDYDSDSGSSSGGGVTDQVVSLVNNERASAGCNPLRVDPRLTAAAQEHSEDMDQRDYVSHESPEGEGPGDRASRHGYDAWGAEHIAKGQTSATQVMDIWMDGQEHRSNILNCELVAIGVGKSGDFWTQKFGWE